MWTKISAWLTAHSNFMNEVQFLANMGHFAWAFGIVLTTAYLSNSNYRALDIVSVAGIALAAAKEFLYDANFELPKQTFKDNMTDFVGYVLGIAAAWVVIGLHVLNR
jgi:hypothetical protein